MTVGPDLDWLANDQGDLRPEALRALEAEGRAALTPEANATAPQVVHEGQHAGAEPARPVTPPRPEPRPGVLPREVQQRGVQTALPDVPPGPQPGRPVRGVDLHPRVQQQPTPARPPIVRFFGAPLWAGVFGLGVLAGIGGVALIRHEDHVRIERHLEPEPAGSVPARALSGATIIGVNVNLRSGPGLGYMVVTKLMDGQQVEIRDERGGWVAIMTNSGTVGWVYGAYVSGAMSTAYIPAVVRRLMVGGAGSSRVVLRPGDRVLHERSDDGRSIALLADGRRMPVEAGGLADVR